MCSRVGDPKGSGSDMCQACVCQQQWVQVLLTTSGRLCWATLRGQLPWWLIATVFAASAALVPLTAHCQALQKAFVDCGACVLPCT